MSFQYDTKLICTNDFSESLPIYSHSDAESVYHWLDEKCSNWYHFDPSTVRVTALGFGSLVILDGIIEKHPRPYEITFELHTDQHVSEDIRFLEIGTSVLSRIKHVQITGDTLASIDSLIQLAQNIDFHVNLNTIRDHNFKIADFQNVFMKYCADERIDYDSFKDVFSNTSSLYEFSRNFKSIARELTDFDISLFSEDLKEFEHRLPPLFKNLETLRIDLKISKSSDFEYLADLLQSLRLLSGGSIKKIDIKFMNSNFDEYLVVSDLKLSDSFTYCLINMISSHRIDTIFVKTDEKNVFNHSIDQSAIRKSYNRLTRKLDRLGSFNTISISCSEANIIALRK